MKHYPSNFCKNIKATRYKIYDRTKEKQKRILI